LLKTLDKYIIKKFLGTYVFMVLLLMSISVVFDISQKIQDFVSNKLSIKEIVFDYYVHFVVLYSNMFSSLIVFLSVIWFTSLMASRSEIVAILSGGVSFNRFLRPFIISATILTLYSLFMNHYVVPFSNNKRLEFETKNVRFHVAKRNTFLEVEKGTLVYFEELDLRTGDVRNIWIEQWQENEDGTWKMTSNIQAKSGVIDSITNQWVFSKYFVREIKHDKEILRAGDRLDTLLNFKKDDLGQRAEIASAMTTDDLNVYRVKEKSKGSENVVNIDLERYQRSALPFASYILTLIAVSVSCRKTRGGIGLNIAMGLTATMLYIFFQRMGQVAAINSGLNTIIAVWLPNMIFAVVAYIFYKTAPK
jgi:lipopolysaccharide export system permease protein